MVSTSNCRAEFTLQGRMTYGEVLRKIEKVDKQLLLAKWEQLDQERKNSGSNRVFCAAVRSWFGADLKE